MGCFTSSCEHYLTDKFEGECDVYGIDMRHKKIFTIEVKTRDTPMRAMKAKQQLDKDEVFLREKYPNLDKLEIIPMYAYSSNKHRGYDVQKLYWGNEKPN